MSTKWIGKVFGLNPDSILLFGNDDTIETPDDDGNFTDLKSYTDYDVQGEINQLTGGSTEHVPISKRGRGMISSTKGVVGKKWTPFSLSNRGKSNKPPGVTSSEIICQKSIEIYSYTRSGLEKHTNYPLELTSLTANIKSVSEMLSVEVFKGESCVLLDVDNLKIPDSTITRGKSL